MVRRSLAAALLLAVAAAAGVVFLSITPPQPVARQILLTVSDSVLFAPRETQRTRYAIHKLVGMYLEYTIAGKMARTAAARTDLHGDVARIAYVLQRANVRMLSAAEVPHDSQDWPVLVAGVGYCDQVNGAVCRILAKSFRNPQLIALRNPSTGTSPHAIGRVWSNERKEWLYFDGFYTQVVFRKTPGGGIEILSNGPRSATPEALRAYRFPGVLMNEYPRTFPGFVASTIRKRWRREPAPAQQLQPPPPPPVASAPPQAAPPPGAAPAPPPRDEAASHRIARTYIRARADDIFGDPKEAKKEYLAVASATGELDPTVKILQAAAQRFGRE
jgi:hypothetical protein